MVSSGFLPGGFNNTACIRPSYTWPLTAQPGMKQARCAEEGFVVETGCSGVQLHALLSGCGPDAAEIAVTASSLLQEVANELLADPQNLAPSSLKAAFQQCHQQLQQLHEQPLQQTGSSSMSTTNVSHSGASVLLVALDPAQQRLLVGSAGLCRAVLARSTPSGDITVMELTPYLALGHDTTETARLDAAGSSICYVPAGAAAAVHRDYQGPANPAGSSSSLYTLCPPEAVLVDPDGQVLPGVKASRMLGYTAAAAAGIVALPVVTSWRLTGAESFIVLGTPGLWAAMSPAEVADYVAAALSAGVGSTSSDAATTPVTATSALGGDAGHGATGAAAGMTRRATVSLGDLLTLEAQERLKLKLMDRLFGMCPGPAAAASCSSGVVPDVSAMVLQLGSIPRSSAVGMDMQKIASELTNITRSCSSNAQALALQAKWSADGQCHGSDAATLGAPPSPALPSLLPVLTVAGGSWPAAFWPTTDPIKVPVLAPAAVVATPQAADSRAGVGTEAEDVTKKYSFEEAAEAAGLLRRSSSRSISSSGAQGLAARSSAFALSSRLSCELDLSHDHGSQGSCGCLTAESNVSIVGSPSEQSMILHKVRLAGAGELESLLFASATTSHPDTTVARVMQHPWSNSLSSSLTGWRSSDTLLSAANAGAFSSSRSGVGRVYSHVALQQQREQQHHHHPPKRSSSVLIAALEMNHRQSAEEIGYASNSGGGRSSTLQQSAAVSFPGSLSTPLLYSYSGSIMHNLEQQQQQQQHTDLVTVKKARSYQALSALHAAAVRTAASVPSNSGDQRSLVKPDSLATPGLSRSAQTQTAGLNGSPIQRLPAAGPSMTSAFRPAFHMHDHAPSTLLATAASDALQASAVAVSMPLSCPLEGLADDLMSPDESEGRVRGGVTRSNSNSSFRGSTESAAAGSQGIAAELQAAAAAAAAAAAGDSCEGKVRHGVPRGRSFRLLPDDTGVNSTEAFASPATSVTQSSLTKTVSAFAAAAMQPVSSEDTEGTVSSKDSSAAVAAATAGSGITSAPRWHQAALSLDIEPSPAARAEARVATPANMAITAEAGQSPSRPESCVRGGRARAAAMRTVFSSPELPSLAHSCAAVDAAYEAALLQPFQSAAKLHRDSSHHAATGSLSGPNSSSLTRAGIAGSFQKSSAFAGAVGSSFRGVAAAMHPAGEDSVLIGMSSWPVSCKVSDGAVHGGELGDESLEGQVHNGRRSNSLSTSLGGLLPSLSDSLSPDEGHLASSSSSKRQHLPLRRSASHCAHSSSNTAANRGSTQQDMSSSPWSSSFVSVRPAAGDVSFSSWQQQVGSSGATELSSAAASPQNPGAPAIEVMRMPSGSFTRVRLSASAPAAAAAAAAPGGYGLAANSVSMGVHGLGIGAGVRLASTSSDDLYGQPIIHTVASAGADSGWYSQFTRVHSGGSGSERRAASSAGAAVGGTAHERAAAGSWSSSRAWGSSNGRRSSIQFGKVHLPQMQPAFATLTDADAATTSRSSRTRAMRDRSSAQGLLPLLTGDLTDVSGSDLHMLTQPLASPGARRQKSQTLPTLKETPSPGSSPQITTSSTSSRTLDLLNCSDLGDLAAQQQQQQQNLLQQQMAELMQEACLSEQQFQGPVDHLAGEVCQESSQDRSEHSATGLMEGYESSNGSLTDLLLQESGQSDTADPDDSVLPSSPGGQAQPGRHSFEFRRHVEADALYGCSPAPMGTSAPAPASQRGAR